MFHQVMLMSAFRDILLGLESLGGSTPQKKTHGLVLLSLSLPYFHALSMEQG
uniref:Uncharacterized protein n=1 Tax=Lepeophtheirus salmonis TaxID=72036 RepID=A0A0K2TVK0_LEPSM